MRARPQQFGRERDRSGQDRARGYRYQLALRLIELSDARVFDRPEAGRA